MRCVVVGVVSKESVLVLFFNFGSEAEKQPSFKFDDGTLLIWSTENENKTQVESVQLGKI